MPSFYPQAMAGQLPLTPPHTASYDAQACHPQYHHDSYAAPQSMPPRLDSAIEYLHRYPPPPSTQQAAFNRQSFCNPQSLPPISSYYEPIGAPVLPPLRMQDAYAERDYYHQYQQPMADQAPQQQQQPAPKEEQTTGGVSAKLDYDMQRMTDFVSEAAQGIIQPGTAVHPSFRKWVSQVLSATRLPSATILLSLHYLTVRMQEFPNTIERTDNQLYRLLAVSMILGSKFLDDNTFINRSWSDVSGIKVSELNTLEIKWLALIGFDLHADPNDPNGVSMWIRAWKEYEAHAVTKARNSSLTPLNTDIQRHKSFHSNRNSFQPGHAKTSHGIFTPLSSGTASSASTPYSSSDPWNSNDSRSRFYSAQPRYQSMEALEYNTRFGPHVQNRASQYPQYSLPPLQSLAPSFFPAPSWGQSSWEHPHGYGCPCVGCIRQATYNFGTHFAPQTVVG